MRRITTTARRLLDGGRLAAPRGGARRAAVVIATVAFAQGCGGDARNQEPVTLGHALYQANCVACHGEDARGGGPMARTLPIEPPSILEHLGHHREAELVTMIRRGIPPAMPPTALSEDEIREIIDHAWTLVPESEVAALRAMQQQMEMMGDAATQPAMPSMPGMDHSRHLQDTMPEMDHSQHIEGSTPGIDHSQHMPGTTSMSRTNRESIRERAEPPAGAVRAKVHGYPDPHSTGNSDPRPAAVEGHWITLASSTFSIMETAR
jgi:mono/diheme cytochrome c family protein